MRSLEVDSMDEEGFCDPYSIALQGPSRDERAM